VGGAHKELGCLRSEQRVMRAGCSACVWWDLWGLRVNDWASVLDGVGKRQAVCWMVCVMHSVAGKLFGCTGWGREEAGSVLDGVCCAQCSWQASWVRWMG